MKKFSLWKWFWSIYGTTTAFKIHFDWSITVVVVKAHRRFGFAMPNYLTARKISVECQ